MTRTEQFSTVWSDVLRLLNEAPRMNLLWQNSYQIFQILFLFGFIVLEYYIALNFILLMSNETVLYKMNNEKIRSIHHVCKALPQ